MCKTMITTFRDCESASWINKWELKVGHKISAILTFSFNPSTSFSVRPDTAFSASSRDSKMTVKLRQLSLDCLLLSSSLSLLSSSFFSTAPFSSTLFSCSPSTVSSLLLALLFGDPLCCCNGRCSWQENKPNLANSASSVATLIEDGTSDKRTFDEGLPEPSDEPL